MFFLHRASARIDVVGIISSNWILLLLASTIHDLLFDSNVLTIEEFIEPIIDGIV